jgi:NADH:ubiquinone oxidoreductase subunit 6 (subunit J)
MLAFGTDLINGAALWKIILASLIGGAGVAIAFGLILIGLTRAGEAKSESGRLASYAFSTLAGAFCLAAVVAGVIATVQKPSSSKAPAPPSKSAKG